MHKRGNKASFNETQYIAFNKTQYVVFLIFKKLYVDFLVSLW